MRYIYIKVHTVSFIWAIAGKPAGAFPDIDIQAAAFIVGMSPLTTGQTTMLEYQLRLAIYFTMKLAARILRAASLHIERYALEYFEGYFPFADMPER